MFMTLSFLALVFQGLFHSIDNKDMKKQLKKIKKHLSFARSMRASMLKLIVFAIY